MFQNLKYKGVKLDTLVRLYKIASNDDKTNVNNSLFDLIKKEFFNNDDIDSVKKELKEVFVQYVIDSNLNIEDKTKLLSNSDSLKVVTNYVSILNVNDTVKDFRFKMNLKTVSDVIHHLIYQSPDGRSSGCGCLLCKLKNKLYTQKVYHNTVEHQLKVYSNMLEYLEESEKYASELDSRLKENTEISERLERLSDPFQNEFFYKTGTIFLKKPITRDEQFRKRLFGYKWKQMKESSKFSKDYKIGVLDPTFDIQVIEDRLERARKHLLNVIEKSGINKFKLENMISEFKNKSMLP